MSDFLSPKRSSKYSKFPDPLARFSSAASRTTKVVRPASSSTKSTAELRKERKKKAVSTSRLTVQHVQGDGNCLFRSVSIQIYGDETWHDRVREECMDFIEKDREHFQAFVAEEDFDSYVRRKRRGGTFGDNTEIQAMAELYNRPVIVFEPLDGAAAFNSGNNSLETEAILIVSHDLPAKFRQLNIFHNKYANDDAHHAPIRLAYFGRNHYDAIVDPYAATVGVGLGLPSFKPGQADRDLLKTVSVVADVEATEKEMERAVMEESVKDMLQRPAIDESPNKRMRVQSSGDMENAKPSISPSSSSVDGSVSARRTASNEVSLILLSKEYPSSVRELILNGFPADNVLAAYAVVGDSFDSMLSLLVSGAEQEFENRV